MYILLKVTLLSTFAALHQYRYRTGIAHDSFVMLAAGSIFQCTGEKDERGRSGKPFRDAVSFN